MTASFGMDRRLRRRADFDAAFARGSKRHGRLMSVFVVATAAKTTRLGIAASRKIGGAVARNRAKRRIRETFRLSGLDQRGADIVVVPRKDVLASSFSILRDEFTTLVNRAMGASRGVHQVPRS